jgi:hypothetical protein
VPFRRTPFADVIERQLDLFLAENAGLLADADAALAAYNRAERDEAEERYGDYADRVDWAREALEDLRDTYARTLDEDAAEEYEAAFNAEARVRFPDLSLELD